MVLYIHSNERRNSLVFFQFQQLEPPVNSSTIQDLHFPVLSRTLSFNFHDQTDFSELSMGSKIQEKGPEALISRTSDFSELFMGWKIWKKGPKASISRTKLFSSTFQGVENPGKNPRLCSLTDSCVTAELQHSYHAAYLTTLKTTLSERWNIIQVNYYTNICSRNMSAHFKVLTTIGVSCMGQFFLLFYFWLLAAVMPQNLGITGKTV